MGAFGAMFPRQRIRHEAGEAGNAQREPAIRAIDLENNTVTLRRPAPPAPDADDGDDGDDGPARE